MSGSLRALLAVFGLLLAAGLALDLAVLVLLAGVGMLVVIVTAWIEAEVSAPQTAAELLDSIRARAVGAERDLARREAVDCVVNLAKIHALPLDHFVARQLDITLGAAQDLLREARRDGLVPAITRAKGRR